MHNAVIKLLLSLVVFVLSNSSDVIYIPLKTLEHIKSN